MYEMTVPSTGQKVRYRPYLVKEEKVMMMAFESQDPKNTLDAIVDTIKACVEGDVDYNKLTSFDVEYMFIKLRSKSVGETSTVTVKCPEESCKKNTELTIDLESIEVEVPEKNNLIEVAPGIIVEFEYPSYKSIADTTIELGQENPDSALTMIAKSITAILTENERINARDESIEELKTFLESMTNSQFLKIAEFFENMPRLKKDIEYRCIGCGKEEKISLRNLQDFF